MSNIETKKSTNSDATEKRRRGVVNPKIMTQTEAAYVAAFMDGEGSFFGIMEKRKKNRSGVRFRFQMSVVNTDVRSLDAMVEYTGNGFVRSGSPRKNPNHKPIFKISWSNKQMLHIIPQLIPHLVIKKRQAELVLEGMEARVNAPYISDQMIMRRQEIYKDLCALNHRGPPKGHQYQLAFRSTQYIPKRYCSIDGCGKIHWARGLCRRHAYQEDLGRDPKILSERKCKGCGGDIPPKARVDTEFCSRPCKFRYHRREGCYSEEALKDAPKCSVDGCDRPRQAQNLCRRHYMQKWHAEQKSA